VANSEACSPPNKPPLTRPLPAPTPPRLICLQADIVRLFKLEERFSRPLDTPATTPARAKAAAK
jgi:hypothetical protein